MTCKCTQFYDANRMVYARCKFAKHPEPALCGVESKAPLPPPVEPDEQEGQPWWAGGYDYQYTGDYDNS